MKKPNATQEKVIIKPRPPKDSTSSQDQSIPCEESVEAPVGGQLGGPVASPGMNPNSGNAEIPAEEEEE